jgi:hypothetical protein
MNFIKFSKFRSGNMANRFLKYLCCHPSSTVVSQSQVSLTLWFQVVLFGMDIWACSGTTAQKQRRRTRLFERFCKISINFVHILSPLYAKPFLVSGYSWKTYSSPFKILVSSWWMSKHFFSCKTSTNCWNRLRKNILLANTGYLKKFTIIYSLFTIFWYIPHRLQH